MLYRIFIPSTYDNKPIDNFSHSERAARVFRFLSRLNGGATVYNSVFGGWLSDGQIVGEGVIVVESFGDDTKLAIIARYSRLLRVEWLQDAIGLQVVECDMMFL